MKIIKYILFTVIAVTLWVTVPIWMPKSNYNHSTDTSQIDTFVSKQKVERNDLLKIQDEKLAKFEEKFGKKSSIMPAVSAYWAKTYTDTDSFELLKCSYVRPRTDGWSVVCSFRIKSKTDVGTIEQDTYIIKNGLVSKQ